MKKGKAPNEEEVTAKTEVMVKKSLLLSCEQLSLSSRFFVGIRYTAVTLDPITISTIPRYMIVVSLFSQ